jgi:hypothetical protein
MQIPGLSLGGSNDANEACDLEADTLHTHA